jgi:very-short-patch-repair endonuclease
VCSSDLEKKEKIKKTNIEKYGAEYFSMTDEYKDKMKIVANERYGVDHYSQTDEYKEKIKKTNMERYGVECYSATDEYKVKIKETNLERYGVEHYTQTDEYKVISKQTNMDRYGCEHPMQNDEVKDKIKQTNLERFGVEFAIQKNFTEVGKKVINNPNLLQEYFNSHTVYELQDIFGCESTTIYNLANKYNLTIPYRTGSSYENIISNILTENGIDHIRGDRSIIGSREIDIYIPSHNLAIEVNGIYWHTESKGKDKNYHYNKWKSCHDKGIQLLSIWEDEFVDRQNTWISKILHTCNSNKERIHARKCQIIPVSKEGVEPFINKYHLQGFAVSSHHYGAYYNGDLVAVMTFSNTRDNTGIQMNRFCLKNGVIISGIANRLLKAFVTDNPEVNEIVTFSDNRYSNGGIYEKMGFEKIHDVSPDYNYIKGNKRYHKAGFRKSAIARKFDIDMTDKTEKQAMKELGYEVVWDCGKVKWAWKKNS